MSKGLGNVNGLARNPLLCLAQHNTDSQTQTQTQTQTDRQTCMCVCVGVWVYNVCSLVSHFCITRCILIKTNTNQIHVLNPDNAVLPIVSARLSPSLARSLIYTNQIHLLNPDNEVLPILSARLSLSLSHTHTHTHSHTHSHVHTHIYTH